MQGQNGTENQEEPGYYSVGELARRVGVTVRTIQYYDQAGLLAPSAKGNQNKRLYTVQDAEDLNRILMLKYLGLSLKEIKAEQEDLRDPAALRLLIDEKMAQTQEEMQALLDRMSTLRAVAARAEFPDVTWEKLVKLIDDAQEKSEYFWRLTCVSDDIHSHAEEESASRASQWHEIIIEALQLMDANENDVDQSAVRNLAKRYRTLCESGSMHGEGNFILLDNVPSHGYDDASFESLRKSVFAFLQRISAE